MSPTAQTEAADQGSAQSQPSADAGTHIPRSPRVLTPLESEMLAALKACRSKFEEYALSHYRKHTAEGDEKAMTNQRMATLCDDLIAKATGA